MSLWSVFNITFRTSIVLLLRSIDPRSCSSMGNVMARMRLTVELK
jgi:hypothetical protein